MATIGFSTFGDPGWLTFRAGGPPLAILAILGNPGRDGMVGDGPMAYSPDMRWIDLPASSGAVTGDLVTVAGATWLLSRSPDADLLGLSQQWIGIPLNISVGAVTYHATGYPLVAWNGVEWVISN